MGNRLCHFEFTGSDAVKTKEFYSKVFDWKFQKWSDDYTMIQTGKEPDGGIMTKPADAPAPCFQAYFIVDSIEATLAKVKEAGGNVVVPKRPVQKIGFFAIFLDMDNIAVGIWESAKK